MKIKFLVMNGRNASEVSRHDTYEEAEKKIMKTPKDLMGTVEFFIRKIYTNE